MRKQKIGQQKGEERERRTGWKGGRDIGREDME